MPHLALTALEGLPEVEAGDDLASLILAALDRLDITLVAGDVLAVAQKVVSKSEGCLVDLAQVSPSSRALELAAITGKDPRYVQVVLDQSREVVRAVPGVLVVEDVRGFVMANAGIDQSNVPGSDRVLLLPADPDASAKRLREAIETRTGVATGVLVNDSFGRAWRNGVVGTALGVSGFEALIDLRGKPDRDGRMLRITQVALADELAAAASLLMGQGAEGTPVVHVRGMPASAAVGAGATGSARDLLRARASDLFR
jgi:coenzyme F420-0:L-glutamate ligase/coenzyme F420-1:gamma-L-glutamate ligase